VKAENLLRHLDDTHPRHADTPSLKERLRTDERYRPAARPGEGFRVRRWHVATIAAVLLIAAGAYAVAPLLDPWATFSVRSCIPSDPPAYHIHPFLRIDIEGSPYPIPGGIGITSSCTNPVHTHDGHDPTTHFVEVHVEAPVRRSFTLGDFFLVWGQPFSPSQVLSHTEDGTNRVTMTVNGSPNGLYGSLVLADQQQIVITYGP